MYLLFFLKDIDTPDISITKGIMYNKTDKKVLTPPVIKPMVSVIIQVKMAAKTQTPKNPIRKSPTFLPVVV